MSIQNISNRKGLVELGNGGGRDYFLVNSAGHALYSIEIVEGEDPEFVFMETRKKGRKSCRFLRDSAYRTSNRFEAGVISSILSGKWGISTLVVEVRSFWSLEEWDEVLNELRNPPRYVLRDAGGQILGFPDGVDGEILSVSIAFDQNKEVFFLPSHAKSRYSSLDEVTSLCEELCFRGVFCEVVKIEKEWSFQEWKEGVFRFSKMYPFFALVNEQGRAISSLSDDPFRDRENLITMARNERGEFFFKTNAWRSRDISRVKRVASQLKQVGVNVTPTEVRKNGWPSNEWNFMKKSFRDSILEEERNQISVTLLKVSSEPVGKGMFDCLKGFLDHNESAFV